MRTLSIRIGAVSVALAAALACSGEHRLPGSVGEPVPAYAAVTLAGDSISLASLRGDVVLLNIWATWCHPCREEIPALQRLHERLAESGLRVVGVSIDAGGEGERVAAFTREFGVTYAIWLDPDERVAETFYTIGVPTTLLIDRRGTVRWRHTGPVRDTDAALLRALDTVLADAPPAAASGG